MKIIKERFNAKIKKTNGCWIWLAATRSGYGTMKINGKMINTHRLSYELYNGPIPKGLYVLHKCDNKKCVNPEHLFLGNQDINMKDMAKKDRHLYGEKSPLSKLKEEEVKDIRSRKKYRGLQTDLAKEFNIDQTTISLILNNKIWKHI